MNKSAFRTFFTYLLISFLFLVNVNVSVEAENLRLWLICAFAAGGEETRLRTAVKAASQGGCWGLPEAAGGGGGRPGAAGLTHGALPHQADELMRPRLPRHPQQDLPDRAVGEPAALKNTPPHTHTSSAVRLLIPGSIFTLLARARARAGDGFLVRVPASEVLERLQKV